MPSAWVAHVKSFYQAQRKKDPKYKYSSAMKDARASYKKGGDAKGKDAKGKDDEKAPAKPKRRRKKAAAKAPAKKARKGKPPRDPAEPAAAASKKSKPKRKRPGVPKDFTNLN
jgi:hypothetical protein